MPTLLELREQVRQILTTEFNNVVVDASGDFNIRHESAHVFIHCNELPQDEGEALTFVDVAAPVLLDVAPTPELFEYMAINTSNYMFGHLSAVRNEDGTVGVMMTHRLLADYLDTAELTWVVGSIAYAADDLDDELKSRFGGVRAHED